MTSYAYTATPDGRTVQSISKTDAKGQVLRYEYDTYNRVLTVKKYATASAPERVCERITNTYDTNLVDTPYSTFSWGKMTSATTGITDTANADYASCAAPGVSPQVNQNFTQMFGYNPAGQMVGKRLRLTQVTGGNSTPVNTDWDTRYEYEGRRVSRFDRLSELFFL